MVREETGLHDVIVIGAGVAGLQCARRLRSAGAEVLIVDRADKVGGRCATRSFDGQPFDYGPLFIHGYDPRFLASVEAVTEAGRLEGWPQRIRGTGTPCQPDAFAPYETRLGFAEGLHAFPHALAAGLEVKLHTQIASAGAKDGRVTVVSTTGDSLVGRDVVLAMALEQSVPFLRMLAPVGLDGALELLGMFASVPCLTVAAEYPSATPAPDWDIFYPEDDPALLLIGNESAKRPQGHLLTMVVQAAPRWSRDRLEEPKEAWSRELLACAARRLGAWAASPERVHPHRWRFARLDRANELAAPMTLRTGTSRIGLVGDLFAPGGGVQAAWLSGDRLGEEMGGS